MGRLEGKIAFITGAARGQGRSHAVHLAAEGADIIAIDACADFPTVGYPMATPADLAETTRAVEALDRRIVSVQADVRDFQAVRAAVDRGVEELGGLDIVCVNHGVVSYHAVVDMPVDAWREMIDINLTGVFNTAKATVPHIQAGASGGSVVVTSSATALRPVPHIAHYTAAKNGVIGFVRTLAIELAPSSIRVNSVHPTNVDTDMMQNPATYALMTGGKPDATREDASKAASVMNALPVPWVDSADVSKAVLFLVSDDARYITGCQLPVDAGMSLL